MDSEYIDEHINLNLVPFGNAGYDLTTKVYTCQHGPQECKINRFQGCIIKFSGGEGYAAGHLPPFSSKAAHKAYVKAPWTGFPLIVGHGVHP
mmetsp:Transcript_31218/g.26655  ORF Transcript_31218/g.26655 Transcript_31218/m.26655 type:complete len:92 (+) Transcript_31218:1-276(+)